MCRLLKLTDKEGREYGTNESSKGAKAAMTDFSVNGVSSISFQQQCGTFMLPN
jgi:hypothetical protein